MLRQRLPPENPVRTDLDAQLGILALFDDHPDSAQRRMEAALNQHSRRDRADHPSILGARCGIGIALARQRKTEEAEHWLRPACERYAQAGVRMPWLGDEGRRTLASLHAR